VTALCHLLLAAALSSEALEQRLGDAVCRLELDGREVSLSGELKLTLSIEGRAPVEVETPRPLTPSPDWRVRSEPPRTTELGGGRQLWQQTFHLEPFQAGLGVPLPIAPVRYRTGYELRDWTVSWPPQAIHVNTALPDADLGHARSVTGIEELPPEEPRRRIAWFVAAAVLFAVFLILAASLFLRQRVTGPQRLTPLARALAELHLLEARGAQPEDLPRLADIVRQFLEDHFQLRATRQTTAEFMAALHDRSGLNEAGVKRIAELLQRCDLVKFAGRRPPPEECESLLQSARHVISENSAPAQSAANGSILAKA
jgi:hypothetical protein